MLTPMADLLQHARRHRYAVPAFDCVEDVMVRTILDTAERLQSPVILMCLPVDLEGPGIAYLSGMIRTAAECYSTVCALHLDHAQEMATVERAIESGFTSVMIDGSQRPFDENVALTRRAVERALPAGVSVEGELGHVGGMDLDAKACGQSVLTEPDEVARFVEQTGVDALAVSIGTAHGLVEQLPVLALDRLEQLNAVSPVPLVLHGGSGTPEDQLKAAVERGIAKLNIYADCRIAMRAGLQQAVSALTRPDPLPGELFGPMREQLAAVVAKKMELLGSVGRTASIGSML